MLETATDRLEFFNTRDFAVDCLLVGPPDYSKTIQVIFNAISDPITLYDTNIETARPHFFCLAEQIADLNRRLIKQFTATLNGKTYELERLTDDQDGLIVTAYLKT